MVDRTMQTVLNKGRIATPMELPERETTALFTFSRFLFKMVKSRQQVTADVMLARQGIGPFQTGILGMSGDSGEQVQIRALTRKSRKGKTFTRPKSVERQICSLLSTSIEEITSRLKIRDKTNEGYLRDETLVYLFREWHREAVDHPDHTSGELEHALYPLFCELERRLLVYLKKSRYKPTDPIQYEEWLERVNASFVEKLVDLAEDRIDFAEAKFLLFAAREAQSQRKSIRREAKRRGQEILIDEDRDDAPKFELPSGAISPEEKATIGEAFEVLPDELFDVVILADLLRLPIESGDPSVQTVSKLLGVTPRTVRNRRAKARRLLAEHLGRMR